MAPFPFGKVGRKTGNNFDQMKKKASRTAFGACRFVLDLGLTGVAREGRACSCDRWRLVAPGDVFEVNSEGSRPRIHSGDLVRTEAFRSSKWSSRSSFRLGAKMSSCCPTMSSSSWNHVFFDTVSENRISPSQCWSRLKGNRALSAILAGLLAIKLLRYS